MTPTRPSYAAIFHRLASLELVDGAELLALPGVEPDLLDPPIHPALSYCLEEAAPLIELAGRLADDEMPGMAEQARVIALDLQEHVEAHGYITSTLEAARSVIWQVGVNADLATQLPKG
ncbi:hypothetical protein Pla123a_30200 [Posidoniimonas polymericola]|uniref:Uncharacterized protein n=1 Tax=Posidoniimonas polymericola TaxID=2528002 RepID=A0A5C5YKY6_9BACT|nr:hypothetical protein [Posidoniimonas polymericola]TWT75511.1 hypothetical protein Pla123a_30200 [Posidoniimonas polymericola]